MVELALVAALAEELVKEPEVELAVEVELE